MTQNTSSAFDHPEVRAASMPMDSVHDRLSLRDHIVEVEIGAFQAERDVTQRVSFDVVVEVSAPDADLDDDVDRILSYDRLTWAIEHELAAERLNLLETLAERIADRILAEPQALRVFIRIQKLDKGNGKLGVEVVRVPGQGAQSSEDDRNPIVAFLSNEALESTALPEVLSNIASDDPLVLSLDLPVFRPAAPSEAAQKQIDLLAIEQAAWQLVAQLDGFTVAATRTELDWVMKTGQRCIWAPSRLINDATDGIGSNAGVMAVWFAEQWKATKIINVGGSLPASDTIPVENVTLGHADR